MGFERGQGTFFPSRFVSYCQRQELTNVSLRLYSGTAARYALEVGGKREDIIQRLLSLPAANPGTASASGSDFTANGASASGPALAANGGATSSTNNEIREGATSSTNNEIGEDSEMEDDTADEIATNGEEEERDHEIEGDIADEIAKVDALSAYDINLDKEVEAINEYLVMLDASQDSG